MELMGKMQLFDFEENITDTMNIYMAITAVKNPDILPLKTRRVFYR